MAVIDRTDSPVDLDVGDLYDQYRMMFLIRRFEEAAERQYKAARIGGYCHLSSGQEAATVGAVSALQPDDLLVTGYRSHGFALARGVPADAVMAELFGRAHGCAHGRGGSMHLLDVSRGYYGGWGIVAGQLPIATGMALSLVRRGAEQAVLCELGDGAVNMGAWHESLNLAGVWDLPIVFFVVNNLYGMGTSVERASAEPDIFKRAGAYRMEGERVDGDDLEEVEAATARLLRAAREDRRPAVLEAVTYRYRGHSVADAGLAYRTREEIEEHRSADPLARTREILESRGVPPEGIDAIEAEVEAEVEAAVAFAERDEAPAVDRLAAGMYAPGSEGQFERMRPGSPFGEAELVFAGGLGA
ncbi:MAG: pyruvate dehydrogenase (acetyl-transferring) E1 component subunit alpha [Actinobacteria bacterium]|nr:pyruvate dehydrogenase (acetyl-transferring) E1 component subunit alpha [Actinomycetota bacterium]